MAVETFVNKRFNVMYDGSNWQGCDGWVDMSGPACRDMGGTDIGFTTFDDFDALVMSENDRKHVNIGRWDQTLNGGSGGMVDYVYLSGDGITAGFYEATRNQMGMLTPLQTTTPASFTNGDMLNIDIGGSVYINTPANSAARPPAPAGCRSGWRVSISRPGHPPSLPVATRPLPPTSVAIITSTTKAPTSWCAAKTTTTPSSPTITR